MSAQDSEELTLDELAFRFLGGRISLSFTATVGERWRRAFERLRNPDDLSRWLIEAGILARPISVSQLELESARALREAIYRSAKALATGVQPRRADISLINRCARAPTASPQLGSGLTLSWKADDDVTAALSLIARDAIDLFAGKWAARIRECESDQCALLFVDLSRPNRRRWCSSETCGSRARSAAYRSRSEQ